MSVILKSNVPYSGNKKLKSATVMSMTSQQYFDAYKARVLADGGIIVDETKTKATIDFLFANDLLSRAHTIVSASYGVRKNLNDEVDKLYSISGSDLVLANYGGAIPKLNATEQLIDNQLSASSTTTGTLYKTEKPVRISAKGIIGLIIVAKMDKADTAQPTMIGYSDMGENNDANARGKLIFTASKFIVQNPSPNNNVATSSQFAAATKAPIIHRWNIANITTKTLVDGVAVYNTTSTLDPNLLNLSRYLQVGGGILANAKSFSHYDWYSAWALFDFDDNEALLINQHLKTM